VYLALGHDAASWEHPAFRHLVVEGTRWLLDHSAD
jgi:type 1 glutamine amidotransferase